jgi:hypothetical protein
MESRKLQAMDLAVDVRIGLSYLDLLEKYELTNTDLDEFLAVLADRRVIRPEDVPPRMAFHQSEKQQPAKPDSAEKLRQKGERITGTILVVVLTATAALLGSIYCLWPRFLAPDRKGSSSSPSGLSARRSPSARCVSLQSRRMHNFGLQRANYLLSQDPSRSPEDRAFDLQYIKTVLGPEMDELMNEMKTLGCNQLNIRPDAHH